MSKVESLKASVKICMFDQYGPVVDMPAALARLQARYKLVVLSNGDPDMLESAKHYHGIPFNRVISVAEAGSFKPHVATYTTAAKLLDVRMDEVLFVANHAFDCIGAKSAGMPHSLHRSPAAPVWHNPHQPDILVRTMAELADVMACSGPLRRGASP